MKLFAAATRRFMVLRQVGLHGSKPQGQRRSPRRRWRANVGCVGSAGRKLRRPPPALADKPHPGALRGKKGVRGMAMRIASSRRRWQRRSMLQLALIQSRKQPSLRFLKKHSNIPTIRQPSLEGYVEDQSVLFLIQAHFIIVCRLRIVLSICGPVFMS